MCFSAQASFGAAAILTIIGIVALKKTFSKKRYEAIPFASVPMLFAMQQFVEGIVWIAATHPEYQHYLKPAAYGFLFFAFFLWPIWIPFSLYHVERNAMRKNLLAIALGIGATVSTGLAYLAWLYGISSSISCSHVAYAINLPSVPHWWALACYLFATITPFFISTKRKAWFFGMLVIASVAATLWFYSVCFTSVWCFFAALLSVAIFCYV